jgi:hypothetical protein
MPEVLRSRWPFAGEAGRRACFVRLRAKPAPSAFVRILLPRPLLSVLFRMLWRLGGSTPLFLRSPAFNA